jgi:hypothetical protein
MLSSARRLFIAAVSSSALCLGASAVAASSAQADSPNQSCPASAVSQPFSQWGDQSSYELTPGGDFESSSWTLQGGAAQVPGSEPYAATGSQGASSLSLSAGGSATSPPICLDASEPTLRFFIGGSGLVLVQMVAGGVTIPVGVAYGNGNWQPSPVVLTGSRLLGFLSGGSAQASIRVTALSGQPQVDDVFIDPWRRG